MEKKKTTKQNTKQLPEEIIQFNCAFFSIYWCFSLFVHIARCKFNIVNEKTKNQSKILHYYTKYPGNWKNCRVVISQDSHFSFSNINIFCWPLFVRKKLYCYIKRSTLEHVEMDRLQESRHSINEIDKLWQGNEEFFYRTKSQNLDALLTIHDILIKGNCWKCFSIYFRLTV